MLFFCLLLCEIIGNFPSTHLLYFFLPNADDKPLLVVDFLGHCSDDHVPTKQLFPGHTSYLFFRFNANDINIKNVLLFLKKFGFLDNNKYIKRAFNLFFVS